MSRRAKVLVQTLLGVTGVFVFGALASHVPGLIAAAGGVFCAWGFVIANDYRGATTALEGSWPRSISSRLPDWQLRVIGWGIAAIGAVWMVAAIVKAVG